MIKETLKIDYDRLNSSLVRRSSEKYQLLILSAVSRLKLSCLLFQQIHPVFFSLMSKLRFVLTLE